LTITMTPPGALPCSSVKVYILRWLRNLWGMPPSTLRSTQNSHVLPGMGDAAASAMDDALISPLQTRQETF
jgi:hypothetical protein